jgi:hypothetical protein
METINGSSTFLNALAAACLDIRDVCIQFLPFIVVIVFAYGFIMFLFGMSEDHKLDLKKYLFMPLFYTMLIVFYPTFIDTTGAITGTIVRNMDAGLDGELIVRRTKVKEELEQIDDLYAHQEFLRDKLEAQKETNAVKKTWKYLAAWCSHATVSVLNGLSSFWDFFDILSIRIIRTAIDYIRDVFLGIMIVVGSIAILLSILPLFKGLFVKWLKLYITIILWAVTISVLDRIMIGFAEGGLHTVQEMVQNAEKIGEYKNSVVISGIEAVFSSPNNPAIISNAAVNSMITQNITDFPEKYDALGGSNGLDIALNVILVICYCLVPYITSLYAGGEASGMFMSKVVGIASMATRNLANKTRTANRPIGAAKRFITKKLRQ